MKAIKDSAEIKIPRTLNENILGKCNMEYPEDAPEVVGAASPEFAKAIKDRRDLEKKAKEDFKDQDKVTKEFVKETANIDLKEDRMKVLRKKRLHEGPGAGYVVESKGYNLTGDILSFSKKEVDGEIEYTVDVNMTGTVDKLVANSYYYVTDKLRDLPIKCTKVRFYVDKDDNTVEDDMLNLITDELSEANTSITVGGGWLHKTYEGEVTNIENYLDNVYYDMSADIVLTDEADIQDIDIMVQGEYEDDDEISESKKSEKCLKESVETKLYKRAENLADELDLLIAELGKVDHIEDYITHSDFDHLNKASEVLQDFAIQYNYTMDSENTYESLKEEDDDTAKNNYTKKHEPKDKKTDLLRNQISTDIDDLWLDVYDELDATTSPGFVKDMNRAFSVKKGGRYNQVKPDMKDPYKIWAYGNTDEDFEFARKVADHYGIKIDEPEKCGHGEPYYKLRIGLHVDQPAQ